jgi:hypothetical protein
MEYCLVIDANWVYNVTWQCCLFCCAVWLLDHAFRDTFNEINVQHASMLKAKWLLWTIDPFSPLLCSLNTFVEISLIQTFCKNLYNTVIKIFIIPENVVLNLVQKQYIQNKDLSFKVTMQFGSFAFLRCSWRKQWSLS